MDAVPSEADVTPAQLTAAAAAANAPATPEPISARPRWKLRLPDALLVVVVAAATAFYLVLSRPLWFFGDDWEFLLERGTVPEADRGLWLPHNEHWSTGPILIYRALFAVFGLRQYLPFALPVLLAHALAVVLVYTLLVRLGAGRWVSLGVSAVVAFNGAGAENTLWDFQIGFVGSVALGLVAAWLYERYDDGGWQIWPTWAALVMGLTFSSIGVVMVVFVAGYALCRRGVRSAALVVCLPAVVFFAWFLRYGRSGVGMHPQAGLFTTMQLLPGYIWTGLTHSWQALSGIPGSGAVIVLALLAGLLIRTPPRLRHLAWAGVVAAFAQLCVSGYARAAISIEQSTASRYTYIVVVLMAPALALCLHAVVSHAPSSRVMIAIVGLGLLGLVLLQGLHDATAFRNGRLAASATFRDRILAAAALVRDGAPLLNSLPDRELNPNITSSLLGRREIANALPTMTPSVQGRLDAAANLQVVVTPTDVALPRPTAVQLAQGFTELVNPASGCHAYLATGSQPVIRMLTADDGARLTVTGDSTQIVTRLERDGLTSDAVPWTTSPSTPQTVATTVPRTTLVVTLNRGGQVTVCT